MRRRQFFAVLGGAAAARPFYSMAQVMQREKPFRIVTLPDIHPSLHHLFSTAMREAGWIEGRDFVVVISGFQWGVMSGIDATLQRLVAGRPDLILAGNDAHALAARRATASIPIVMSSGGYPVEAGLAESLARPGKNVTGICVYAGAEVWSKLLQLLREAKPDIRRVSVLWTYVPPLFPRYAPGQIDPATLELRNAERLLGLKLQLAEAAGPDQVPAALEEIELGAPDALMLTSGLGFDSRRTAMEFAVKKHLPTITDAIWSIDTVPYPLICYGTRFADLIRGAVSQVDKILRGADPGDLPLQQPVKVELKVNLKTAAAIGITIPPTLLARADEVVE